jgi:hypothetical protein
MSEALNSKASPLKIPAWAKILAAFAGIAIVLAGAGGVYCISWTRGEMLNAIKPAYMEAALKRIGDFPDNLIGPGQGVYHPFMGGRMPLTDADAVAFEEKANNLQFVVARYTSLSSDPDAIEEIDKFYELPTMLPRLPGRFISIVDKGQASIAGHQFNYETVLLKDDKDASYKGMIGCMAIGRKVIMVEAATPAASTLDINFVLDFLRKARAF